MDAEVSVEIDAPIEQVFDYALNNTTEWSTAGGEFNSTNSASVSVGTIFPQSVVCSGSRVIDDVAAWLAAPATNFGWLLRGANDGLIPNQTARRFASRENPIASSRPRLSIGYTVP